MGTTQASIKTRGGVWRHAPYILMFDFWIETSPLEPPDENGYSKGIIHRERTVRPLLATCFPVLITDRTITISKLVVVHG